MSGRLIAQTVIEGYEVLIESQPTDENPHHTCAYVSRGRYHAGLEVLLDMGVLYSGDREHQVPARIIGEIENWAYSNGMM